MGMTHIVATGPQREDCQEGADCRHRAECLVGGEQYRLDLPDGSLREGARNAQGLLRVDGVDPGRYGASLPNLDARDWRRI